MLRFSRSARVLVFASFLALAQTSLAQDGSGMQVLTRGPVHEAFASISVTSATAGIVVRHAPPDPIEELPPTERPDGDNVAWIPGNWWWDEDRGDYIWVSGVWRNLPPGRQWMPGYWAHTADGYQWISGFWSDIDRTDVTYLPPPPAPLDSGPSSPAPGQGFIWVAGTWVWVDTRYLWQPGYWVAPRQNWVWQPANYVNTPRGYVYVSGYWDHDLPNRGVVFAPIYYDKPIYREPEYRYAPAVTIGIAALATALFVQPKTHHYLFGDYYDKRYEDRDIHPWFRIEKDHPQQIVDPLFVAFREREHRRDPEWERHYEDDFQYRREHVDARPPQTFIQQVNIVNNVTNVNVTNITNNTVVNQADHDRDRARPIMLGERLSDLVKDKREDAPRFTRVDDTHREELLTKAREVRSFLAERRKVESVAPLTAATPDAKVESAKVTLAPSPLKAERAPAEAKALPEPPKIPEIDKTKTAPPSEAPRATVLPDSPAPANTAKPTEAPAASPDGRKPVTPADDAPAKTDVKSDAPAKTDEKSTPDAKKDGRERTQTPGRGERGTRGRMNRRGTDSGATDTAAPATADTAKPDARKTIAPGEKTESAKPVEPTSKDTPAKPAEITVDKKEKPADAKAPEPRMDAKPADASKDKPVTEPPAATQPAQPHPEKTDAKPVETAPSKPEAKPTRGRGRGERGTPRTEREAPAPSSTETGPSKPAAPEKSTAPSEGAPAKEGAPAEQSTPKRDAAPGPRRSPRDRDEAAPTEKSAPKRDAAPPSRRTPRGREEAAPTEKTEPKPEASPSPRRAPRDRTEAAPAKERTEPKAGATKPERGRTRNSDKDKDKDEKKP